MAHPLSTSYESSQLSFDGSTKEKSRQRAVQLKHEILLDLQIMPRVSNHPTLLASFVPVLSIANRVPLNLSISPFDWGWCGLVWMCLVWKIWNISSIIFPLNWQLLSVRIWLDEYKHSENCDKELSPFVWSRLLVKQSFRPTWSVCLLLSKWSYFSSSINEAGRLWQSLSVQMGWTLWTFHQKSLEQSNVLELHISTPGEISRIVQFTHSFLPSNNGR